MLPICTGCRRYREQMNFLRTLCRQRPFHPDARPDKENTP